MNRKKISVAVTGVLLLGFLGTTVALSSQKAKQDRIDKLDADLHARWRVVETYFTMPGTNSPGDWLTSGKIESYEIYGLNDLEIEAAQRSKDPDQRNGELDIDKYTSYYNGIDDNSTIERSWSYPIFSDAYGNQIYVWYDYVGLSVAGYLYGLRPVAYAQDQNSLLRDMQFVGYNSESQYATSMLEAAEKLSKEGKKSGWYEDYRYACVQIKTEDYAGQADLYPFDEEYMTFVLFEDASEEMAAWRKYTLWNTLAAGGAYVVIMAVLSLLLLIPGKDEKAKRAEALSASGVSVPAKAGKNVISKDLADKLLGYIEGSEQSTGPSGYLDEMRTLIEQCSDKNN